MNFVAESRERLVCCLEYIYGDLDIPKGKSQQTQSSWRRTLGDSTKGQVILVATYGTCV